ncbi:hypothetical protein JW968_00195 [Candidatus Woesearchaeota archaeon]|nr:hypothetical protein [Candidatus Woesearchaeota archaeon]
MEKARESDAKDYEAWLLGFEKQMERPCVVSLLIEHGKVQVVACFDKKRYLDQPEHDSDDGEPEIDYKKILKDVSPEYLVSRDYIG